MSSARENLAVEKDDSVVIRQDHYPGQYQKSLKLKNYQTGNDTIITNDNFHPVVKPHLKVTRPAGYLIEKNDSLLISWLNRNEIEFFVDTNIGNYKITQYSILKIAKSVDEELENFIPSVKASTIKSYSENDYIFVPTNNIAGNYLVIALEPQSQFGLVQYKMFNYLLKPKKYSIMRVENH